MDPSTRRRTTTLQRPNQSFSPVLFRRTTILLALDLSSTRTSFGSATRTRPLTIHPFVNHRTIYAITRRWRQHAAGCGGGSRRAAGEEEDDETATRHNACEEQRQLPHDRAAYAADGAAAGGCRARAHARLGAALSWRRLMEADIQISLRLYGNNPSIGNRLLC